jgi:hypothetical protein
MTTTTSAAQPAQPPPAPSRRRVSSFLIIVGTALAGVGTIIAAYYSYRSFNLQQDLSAQSTVEFTEPSTLDDGDCSTRVGIKGLLVSGSAQVENSEQIWLLIQAPVAGRFYIPAPGEPLQLQPDGSWSQDVPSIGSGRRREVHYCCGVGKSGRGECVCPCI